MMANAESLLPCGVVHVDTERPFAADVCVSIVSVTSGKEIARGLTNYSSEELGHIKGLQSHEIKGKLGHAPGRSEAVIERENLVLW